MFCHSRKDQRVRLYLTLELEIEHQGEIVQAPLEAALQYG